MENPISSKDVEWVKHQYPWVKPTAAGENREISAEEADILRILRENYREV
jgi:hypothetical protein